MKANKKKGQLGCSQVVRQRFLVTEDYTLRTMTLRSSKELLEENVDKVRAAAGSAAGMTVTSGMTGPLAVELD